MDKVSAFIRFVIMLYFCDNITVMDLQTRKLNAIGYLISLQDDKVFTKIETTILEIQARDKRKLKTFTQKQIIDRAETSNQDYIAGNFKTQGQLEKESENW